MFFEKRLRHCVAKCKKYVFNINMTKKVRRVKSTKNEVSDKKQSNESQDGEELTQRKVSILRGVNAAEILLHHYGVAELKDETLIGEEIQETILEFGNEDIGITDLLHEKSKKSKRSIMFLDPHRGQVKFWGNMIDLTLNGPLPRYTPKPCWWCRNKFSYHPIGCPTRYNSQKNSGIDKKRVEKRITELNLSLGDGNDFLRQKGYFVHFRVLRLISSIKYQEQNLLSIKRR